MKAGASPARLTVPSPGDQAEIAGAAEASRLANKLLAAHSYAEAHAAITDCITALGITPSLARAAGRLRDDHGRRHDAWPQKARMSAPADQPALSCASGRDDGTEGLVLTWDAMTVHLSSRVALHELADQTSA